MVIKGKDTEKTKSVKHKSTINVHLTQDELNILLQLIRNANFNGDMIERLYHLTTKLQTEYTNNKGE